MCQNSDILLRVSFLLGLEHVHSIGLLYFKILWAELFHFEISLIIYNVGPTLFQIRVHNNLDPYKNPILLSTAE